MHDTLRLSDPEARELAAGEYVLGTLTRRQQAEFEALLAVSPELQQSVEAWRERLQALNARLAPVDPPAALWPQIAARAGLERRWWRRLGLWQGISALSTLAALVLAALLIAAPAPPMMDGDYVFVANAEGGRPGWLVSASDSGEMRIQTLAPGPMPAGMACELWMMDNGKPVSLGMLPSSGQKSMRLPEPMRAQLRSADLAVSLEPRSGAPAGKPSGTMLDHGKLVPMRSEPFSL
ncbi:anti-sigma factor domain-containing protein [Salinicola sp. DM10]|uniref:anti-sigma factor n=1 Tax=Salinicola sp. DM10 TaxID=2815721 RepID=UPI001A8FC669|nr:anti-sigma factor [Salinicola sp. DM10]MCE3026815.1 anti-sigma factor [Salinicola sp. DM10]